MTAHSPQGGQVARRYVSCAIRPFNSTFLTPETPLGSGGPTSLLDRRRWRDRKAGVLNLVRRPLVAAIVAAGLVLTGVVSVGTLHLLNHCGARVEFSQDPDDTAMDISHESFCHAPLGVVGVDFDLSRPSQCTWSVFPPDQVEQWYSADGNVSYNQGAPMTQTFLAPAGHVHRTMKPHGEVQNFTLTCQPQT